MHGSAVEKINTMKRGAIHDSSFGEADFESMEKDAESLMDEIKELVGANSSNENENVKSRVKMLSIMAEGLEGKIRNGRLNAAVIKDYRANYKMVKAELKNIVVETSDELAGHSIESYVEEISEILAEMEIRKIEFKNKEAKRLAEIKKDLLRRAADVRNALSERLSLSRGGDEGQANASTGPIGKKIGDLNKLILELQKSKIYLLQKINEYDAKLLSVKSSGLDVAGPVADNAEPQEGAEPGGVPGSSDEAVSVASEAPLSDSTDITISRKSKPVKNAKILEVPDSEVLTKGQLELLSLCDSLLAELESIPAVKDKTIRKRAIVEGNTEYLSKKEMAWLKSIYLTAQKIRTAFKEYKDVKKEVKSSDILRLRKVAPLVSILIKARSILANLKNGKVGDASTSQEQLDQLQALAEKAIRVAGTDFYKVGSSRLADVKILDEKINQHLAGLVSAADNGVEAQGVSVPAIAKPVDVESVDTSSEADLDEINAEAVAAMHASEKARLSFLEDTKGFIAHAREKIAGEKELESQISVLEEEIYNGIVGDYETVMQRLEDIIKSAEQLGVGDVIGSSDVEDTDSTVIPTREPTLVSEPNDEPVITYNVDNSVVSVGVDPVDEERIEPVELSTKEQRIASLTEEIEALVKSKKKHRGKNVKQAIQEEIDKKQVEIDLLKAENISDSHADSVDIIRGSDEGTVSPNPDEPVEPVDSLKPEPTEAGLDSTLSDAPADLPVADMLGAIDEESVAPEPVSDIKESVELRALKIKHDDLIAQLDAVNEELKKVNREKDVADTANDNERVYGLMNALKRAERSKNKLIKQLDKNENEILNLEMPNGAAEKALQQRKEQEAKVEMERLGSILERYAKTDALYGGKDKLEALIAAYGEMQEIEKNSARTVEDVARHNELRLQATKETFAALSALLDADGPSGKNKLLNDKKLFSLLNLSPLELTVEDGEDKSSLGRNKLAVLLKHYNHCLLAGMDEQKAQWFSAIIDSLSNMDLRGADMSLMEIPEPEERSVIERMSKELSKMTEKSKASFFNGMASIYNLADKISSPIMQPIGTAGHWLAKVKSAGLSKVFNVTGAKKEIRIKGEKGNEAVTHSEFSRENTFQRLMSGFIKGFDKERDQADRSLRTKSRGLLSNMSGFGRGIGSAIRYLRIGADVAGKAGGNPLRWVTLGAMAVGKTGNALKEARMLNAELVDETRVGKLKRDKDGKLIAGKGESGKDFELENEKDLERAIEEAWAIYDEAKNSGTIPTKDDISKAYLKQLPKDLMVRLEKGGYSGLGVVKKLFSARGDVGKEIARIDQKINTLLDSKLPEEVKQQKIARLLSWNKEFLDDMDRMVTDVGMVDGLAYSSRLVETTGRNTSTVMMVDSIRLAFVNFFPETSNKLLQMVHLLDKDQDGLMPVYFQNDAPRPTGVNEMPKSMGGTPLSSVDNEVLQSNGVEAVTANAAVDPVSNQEVDAPAPAASVKVPSAESGRSAVEATTVKLGTFEQPVAVKPNIDLQNSDLPKTEAPSVGVTEAAPVTKPDLAWLNESMKGGNSNRTVESLVDNLRGGQVKVSDVVGELAKNHQAAGDAEHIKQIEETLKGLTPGAENEMDGKSWQVLTEQLKELQTGHSAELANNVPTEGSVPNPVEATNSFDTRTAGVPLMNVESGPRASHGLVDFLNKTHPQGDERTEFVTMGEGESNNVVENLSSGQNGSTGAAHEIVPESRGNGAVDSIQPPSPGVAEAPAEKPNAAMGAETLAERGEENPMVRIDKLIAAKPGNHIGSFDNAQSFQILNATENHPERLQFLESQGRELVNNNLNVESLFNLSEKTGVDYHDAKFLDAFKAMPEDFRNSEVQAEGYMKIFSGRNAGQAKEGAFQFLGVSEKRVNIGAVDIKPNGDVIINAVNAKGGTGESVDVLISKNRIGMKKTESLFDRLNPFHRAEKPIFGIKDGRPSENITGKVLKQVNRHIMGVEELKMAPQAKPFFGIAEENIADSGPRPMNDIVPGGNGAPLKIEVPNQPENNGGPDLDTILRQAPGENGGNGMEHVPSEPRLFDSIQSGRGSNAAEHIGNGQLSAEKVGLSVEKFNEIDQVFKDDNPGGPELMGKVLNDRADAGDVYKYMVGRYGNNDFTRRSLNAIRETLSNLDGDQWMIRSRLDDHLSRLERGRD